MSIEVIHLSKPQQKIFMSPKRYKIVNAGRRFGKSFLSGYEILRQVTKKAGSIIWYVAPTWDMAKKIMWDDWLPKHVPREWLACDPNKVDHTYTFVNGSILYVLSADNPDHLRGSGVDLVILDECAFMKDGTWDIISPVLSDKYHNGKSLLISTPKGYNWFYEQFNNAKSLSNWDCFQFTSIEGGNIPEEEIEDKKRTMSKKMFNQEYLASFETLSNRVYEMYDVIKNHCDTEDDWRFGDIHVGIDFNVNPMTAVFFKIIKGSLYIFDEIAEPNSNTQWLCGEIKHRYPKAEVFAYPDPTCRKRQTNAAAGETDYNILRKNGFHVLVPHAPYPSRDKFNSVNSALCNANDECHVFIDELKCPNLKKAWLGYCYLDNGEDTDKRSGLDHISDAAAYGIVYRMPIVSGWGLNRPRVFGY